MRNLRQQIKRSLYKIGLAGFVATLSLNGALLTQPVQADSHGVQVGLPAYVWPTDPYLEDLKDPLETPEPPSVVIVNIGNGDGDVSILDDDADVLRARTTEYDENVKVIGYVWTNYTNRSIADVKDAIDGWLGERNGNVHYDGIFVDETPRDCGPTSTSTAYRDYYREIREYIWDKIPETEELVMNNVGTAVSDCYLETGHDTADVFVTFEGTETTYFQTSSAENGWQGWVGGNIIAGGQYNLGQTYPSWRFWHMVHDTSSTEYEDVLDAAYNRWAGTVTPTDDILANPWDAKPSYLNDAIQYAATLGN